MSEALLGQGVPVFAITVEFVNDIHKSKLERAGMREYHYLCDQFVRDGDYVVVDTAAGLGVGKVVGISRTTTAASRWVVQKLDMSAHQARLKRMAEIAALEEEMEERLAHASKMDRFRAAAANDPRMAQLVQRYEQVSATLVWENHDQAQQFIQQTGITEVRDD